MSQPGPINSPKGPSHIDKQTLEHAFDMAHMGTWSWDVQSGKVEWSKGVYTLFGLSPNQFTPTIESVMGRFHPDYQEQHKKLMRQAITQKKRYAFESKITLPDGQLRYVTSTAKGRYDLDNNLTHIVGIVQDVTEQQTTKRSLIKSEERFRGLFEAMMNGVSIYEVIGDAEELRLRDLNPAGEKLMGRPKAEVIGKRIEDIFPQATKLGMIEPLKDIWRKKQAQHIPATRYRDAQRDLWVERFVARLPSDELMIVAADVSKRTRAEQQRLNSEAFLNNLVDQSPVSTGIADHTGLAVRVNPAWQAFFGLDPQEVVGHYNLFEDNLLKEQGHMDAVRSVAEKGLPIQFRIEYDTSKLTNVSLTDSCKMLIDIHMFPIRDMHNKVTHIVAQHRNVTKQYQAKKQLEEHQKRLKSLASELTLTEERLKRSIATELHDDISQTLAMLRFKVNDIIATTTDPQTQSTLKEVAGTLKDTLNKTRDLTSRLNYPTLNVLGLEKAIAKWLRDEIKTKHKLKAHFQTDGAEKPLSEDMNAVLFRGVREILTNTVKHAQATSVMVSSCREGNHIVLTISDNGTGCHPDNIMHQNAGFGLLSLCEAIERLEGHMQINSTPGQGLKVTLTGPLQTHCSPQDK